MKIKINNTFVAFSTPKYYNAYMDNIILTPNQLWADYNPDSTTLQIAFQEYKDLGEFYSIKGYFNGDTYADGTIRIFFHGFLPKIKCKKMVIIADGHAGKLLESDLSSIVKHEFGVLYFDYRGDMQNDLPHTIYPPSVDYANLLHAGKHLDYAIPTAKDTCVFVWTKVCRRVISLAQQLIGKDSLIYILGLRRGADIAWQTAATDSRVNGLIAVFNAGWKEYANFHKFSEKDIELTDERERWLTGCASQTYAKLVKCPTLFVGTTNCDLTPVDRLENTLNIVAEKASVTKCICAGLTSNIYQSAVMLVPEWLERTSFKAPMPKTPLLDIGVVDKKFIVKVECDKEEPIEENCAYYCYDELNPRLRNWRKLTLDEKGKGEIPVYEHTKYIFVYANTLFQNGFCMSSLPQCFEIEDEEIDFAPFKKSQIIYERKNGTKAWLEESKENEIAEYPSLQAGAFDILGVTASKGNLVTYSIGDNKYPADENNLFQFDCYCQEERELEVELTVQENDKTTIYTTTVQLNGSEQWQKHPIELQSFKTADMMAMKSWRGIKKLAFKDIGGVLINNILWV